MDKKQVRVLGVNVLVELEESENTTKGGIVVPDSVKDDVKKLSKGKVVGKGKGFVLPTPVEPDEMKILTGDIDKDSVSVKYVPLEVSEGDTVYFNMESAEEVMLDGNIYYVLNFHAIKLAVN